MERGRQVMYVKLKKALYGTLQAAIRFWEELASRLRSWGFKINRYDRCVANKTIKGKQCTIAWHVDDLKISHVDPDVVTSIIEKLNKEYGKLTPLTVTRGKIHEYLGIKVDFSESGKVKLSMKDYIGELLEESPADMAGIATSPAANHLFQINDEPTPLTGRSGRRELSRHICIVGPVIR